MFENLFLSLGDTGVGLFLAGSTASFAAVESLHLLGLALLGGAALVTDLTVLRVVFRRADPARIAAALFPLLLIGLSIMVVSGVLLVSPGRCWTTATWMRWKPSSGTRACCWCRRGR